MAEPSEVDTHLTEADRCLLTKIDGLGFAEMRAKFDQTAAGQAHIVSLLTTLIDRG